MNKNLRPPFFRLFCQKFCHAVVESREQQAILLKKWKQSGQNCVFPVFSGGNCGTILSRRSRLSRTSRAPSRLSRPRPIDCHAGPKRTVKTFPGLANSCFEHRRKKSLFSTGPHLVVIHTQKEAHSRIFVTGGSLFARQMQAKKQVVSASRACTQGYCRLKFWGTLIYRVHQQAQHPE